MFWFGFFVVFLMIVVTVCVAVIFVLWWGWWGYVKNMGTVREIVWRDSGDIQGDMADRNWSDNDEVFGNEEK